MKYRSIDGKFNNSITISAGMKFGYLTIIGDSSKRDKSRSRHYICQCDCGNVKEINRIALISKDTKSCGCFNRISKQKEAGRTTWNSIYYTSRRSAGKRNLEFLLNIDQLIAVCSQPCFYCGSEPVAKSRYKDEKRKTRATIFANGIDRVDNNKGYSIENCVPCCSICNEMKMDRNVNFFIQHIKSIFKFQEIKNGV